MKNLLFCIMCLAPSISFSSVSITGTRVIYDEADRSVTVKLTNQGNTTSIVQAWIDDKMTNQAPSDGSSPFILYPAVSKIIGGGEQYLRIKKIDNIKNSEVESLYWLNVKDIPEAPKETEKNHLQFSILTKIKLFYRPSSLKNKVNDIYNDLFWSVEKRNGGIYLIAKNNSNYYISMTEIKLKSSTQKMPLEMIAPKSSAEWILKNITLPDIKSGQAEYGAVNDYGTVIYRPIKINGVFD